MTIKATEFRKDMFGLLESALRGESVDVTYKGKAVHLAPAKTPQKMTRLARLKTAPFLTADSATLDDLSGLSSDGESAWEKKWDERLK